MSDIETIGAIRDRAFPVTGIPQYFDPLLELIGDASLVLLGEASHGTHEFYRARAEITKRLIDVTRAVEPLDPTSGWEEEEVPETCPHAV